MNRVRSGLSGGTASALEQGGDVCEHSIHRQLEESPVRRIWFL